MKRPLINTHLGYNGGTWLNTTQTYLDNAQIVLDYPTLFTDVTELPADTLTTGESTMARDVVNSAAISMVTGILRFAYFTARKTETINSLRLIGGTTAAAATPTLVRAGIYTIAGNGDLTLAASIPSDTAIFATANTAYTRALTAPWAKVSGVRYALGMIVVTGAAAPSVSGNVTTGGIISEASTPPTLAGTATSQTDLPATLAVGSIGGTLSRVYAVMIP